MTFFCLNCDKDMKKNILTKKKIGKKMRGKRNFPNFACEIINIKLLNSN